MDDLDGCFRFTLKLLQSDGHDLRFFNYFFPSSTLFALRKSFVNFQFNSNNKIILHTSECLTHRQIEAAMSVHYSLLHCRQVKRDGALKNQCVEILTKVSLLHSITDSTYTRIFQCAIRKHRKVTLAAVFSSFPFVYCLESSLRDRIFLRSHKKKSADQ